MFYVRAVGTGSLIERHCVAITVSRDKHKWHDRARVFDGAIGGSKRTPELEWEVNHLDSETKTM
jgi:hypothetical protein